MAKRTKSKSKPRKRLCARLVQQASTAMQQPIHPDPSLIRVHDGLTRFQRECVREASTLQHCKAQGEVMAGTMTIQHHWGWTVRRAHPEAERTAYDPPAEPNGITESADAKVVTDHHVRQLRTRKDESGLAEHLKSKSLRTLRVERQSAVASVCAEETNALNQAAQTLDGQMFMEQLEYMYDYL